MFAVQGNEQHHLSLTITGTGATSRALLCVNMRSRLQALVPRVFI
jgi:hypothetical protein